MVSNEVLALATNHSVLSNIVNVNKLTLFCLCIRIFILSFSSTAEGLKLWEVHEVLLSPVETKNNR